MIRGLFFDGSVPSAAECLEEGDSGLGGLGLRLQACDLSGPGSPLRFQKIELAWRTVLKLQTAQVQSVLLSLILTDQRLNRRSG